MDFITGPLITLIVMGTIYGLFELFVRRRERMAIIEKLGDKLDPSLIEGKLNFGFLNRWKGGTSLKVACLMIGIGLGFFVGFIICSAVLPEYLSNDQGWGTRERVSIVYGACLFIFGGLGLLMAFLAEQKYMRNN